MLHRTPSRCSSRSATPPAAWSATETLRLPWVSLDKWTRRSTAADHAEELAAEIGDQFTTLDVALTRAEILIGLGRTSEAATIAEDAAEAFVTLGVPAQAQRAVELAERARLAKS